VLANDSRRVVTGHDALGNAGVRGGDVGARKIGTTINNDSVFRVIDDEPGGTPGNHRTESIDCTVVMSGNTDMEMDGTVGHLKARDVLVPRGTIHHWVNHGTAPCVIAFPLIGSDGLTPVG
jgi:hypothetical protein